MPPFATGYEQCDEADKYGYDFHPPSESIIRLPCRPSDEWSDCGKKQEVRIFFHINAALANIRKTPSERVKPAPNMSHRPRPSDLPFVKKPRRYNSDKGPRKKAALAHAAINAPPANAAGTGICARLMRSARTSRPGRLRIAL